MSRPRLLDLFCGAGGAGMGYHHAGFEVVGVDLSFQPRYPFQFIQGDALEYLDRHGKEYDVIHASPPCQANSSLAAIWKKRLGAKAWAARHPDLIGQTRDLLREASRPYVMENVPGAPLHRPTLLLCGTHFGLKVYRHRLFETSFFLLTPPHVPHDDNCPAVGRGTSRKGYISITGHGGFGMGRDGFHYACEAIGIDWMLRVELSQAIPPAYTRWIGTQLLTIIQRQEVMVGEVESKS